MDSILTSIKKKLGIVEEYEHFDEAIISDINSVFMSLTQIGIGPEEGFVINDKSSTWTDFLPEITSVRREWLTTYVYLKVKLMFDLPNNQSHIQAIKEQIAELEWRLFIAADTGLTSETESDSQNGSGGGTGTGTDDYRKLKNLPKINGTTLVDNYDETDPTIIPISNDDIDNMWEEEA